MPDYPADDWFNPEANEFPAADGGHFKKRFRKTDINSYEFYDGLKSVVSAENSYNYIIVAFGEDIENVDLGNKIAARLETWGNAGNSHIFVKVRSVALIDRELTDASLIKFGSARSVYDMDKIVNNPVKELAYLKSFKYVRDGSGDVKERRGQAVKKWMDLSDEQRAGNFYSCLNLRTKLNLLGLDYAKSTEAVGDLSEKFYKEYYGTADDDGIEEQRSRVSGDCDTAIFRDGSVRTLLAKQEHQRWCAAYVCNGVIPPRKQEIDGKGGGKDMKKRLVHYNLTTFEGLEEYSKLSGEEVRPYDYRIMDSADKMLADAGYKIVEKQYKDNGAKK